MRYCVVLGSAWSPSATVVELVSENAIDIKCKSLGVVSGGTRVLEFDPRIIRDRARLPDLGWAVDRGRRIQWNERLSADRNNTAIGHTRIDIGFLEHVMDARHRRADVYDRRRHRRFRHSPGLRFN